MVGTFPIAVRSLGPVLRRHFTHTDQRNVEYTRDMTTPKRLVVGGLGAALAASGLAVATPGPAHAAPVEIQILATNDFHGRILQTAGNREAGAAVLSGAVKQLRDENPNTVFAAAGDLIGASTFESFIQDDKPTIDALNEAGLEVSAVGNHELDQGYDDLVNRVMAPYDAETNPLGGAEWEYIAANIDEPGDADEIAESWAVSFGDVQVGFVGAVTEDLPSLVSPSGIEGLTVTDIVEATNNEAASLRAAGADVVVMLVHEGSPSTDCASPNFTDPTTAWGNISQNVSDDVDAIVSGHTHLAYNCTIDDRPVVSAGQYGMNLNQLNVTVESTTGEVTGIEQNMVALMGSDPDGSGPGLPPALFPADPAVEPIVSAAVTKANELGAAELGEIDSIFGRAKLAKPTSVDPPNPAALENRGGESTLGNLVAEVHRWATRAPESGAAEIAFMNPGGLRADMTGTVNGDVRDLTYKQAAGVQPFANTLVNMELTGAQIETVLEQQWQRTTENKLPSRPFLRLGVSEGFTYTYTQETVTETETDPDGGTYEAPEGEVTGMWLDGVPIDPAATYSVTVNSFLASGGDNFREFADGASKADTGKVDLEAMVDYMAAHTESAPLPVDYSQRAVEVEFGDDAPASYLPGDAVSFDVASLAMSGRVNATDPVYDIQDDEVSVELDGEVIGTAPVDNTITDVVYDNYGTASVDVTLPADTPAGPATLTLVGEATGTQVIVPIRVRKGAVTMSADVRPDRIVAGKTRPRVVVRVTSPDALEVSGRVTVKVGKVERSAKLVDGRAVVRLPIFEKTGLRTAKVVYGGSDTLRADRATVSFRVVKRR